VRGEQLGDLRGAVALQRIPREDDRARVDVVVPETGVGVGAVDERAERPRVDRAVGPVRREQDR